MLPVILVHLWCIPNKLVLRKDTDIIHVAMGGQKSFYTVEGGFKTFWRLAKGGSKKFDDTNFQLPSPPHQSIYEHSLSDRNCELDSSIPLRGISCTSGERLAALAFRLGGLSRLWRSCSRFALDFPSASGACFLVNCLESSL